jgi:DNA-directed RNA polymerase specialized sigma24 family protein
LTLTAWRIKDQLRDRLPKAADPGGNLMDPNGFVPETYWNEEWQKNQLEVARERVKQKVNPKHYQIFDLHIDQGWPVRKVADRLGVSAAVVHLVRHRITRLLRKEIERLEAEEQKRNENHHSQ